MLFDIKHIGAVFVHRGRARGIKKMCKQDQSHDSVKTLRREALA